MNLDEVRLIASAASYHPKIGTVRIVEDVIPTPGAFVLVSLKFPYRLGHKTTFTIEYPAQWPELVDALAASSEETP